MAKRTAVDKLSARIDAILGDYSDAVQQTTEECVDRVGKAGASALRQASKDTFDVHSGDYYKGWRSKLIQERTGAVSVIYNATTPGLAHLLEHGHLSSNGTKRVFGRVPGREHIAPISQRLSEDFERQIKVEVSKL